MSSKVTPKRLPRHAILDDEVSVALSARTTEAGAYDLLPSEIRWRDRQPYLEKRGYFLRKRYSQGWEPSWLGTNLEPTFCEDSIMLMKHQIMDATRRGGGDRVVIKTTHNNTKEIQISRFLSSIRDEQNHCVPIFEAFPDPLAPHTITLMVMPYLRPCNDPEFSTIGEVVDFINQTMDGLAFLHRYCVAHRDIAVENIMMDGKALYPEGHHPVRRDYTPDAIYPAPALTRTDRPVRYYYIDFGLSVRFPDGASHLVVGDVGRDEEVPELSSTIPYDAFKVDIYALGNLYAKEFEQKYNSMQFLVPLIERMTQRQPDMRPPIDELLSQWTHIRSLLNSSLYRWRLGPKSEPAYERIFNDTVAVAWEGLYHLKRLVK